MSEMWKAEKAILVATHVRSDVRFPAKLAVPAAGEPEELLGVELLVGVFGSHGAENVPSNGLVHQFRTERKIGFQTAMNIYVYKCWEREIIFVQFCYL